MGIRELGELTGAFVQGAGVNDINSQKDLFTPPKGAADGGWDIQGSAQRLKPQFDMTATANNIMNRDANTNANMADRATTLARSRQVDALNNRVYFQPAVLNAGAEALGGAGYQQGYGQYQMPQIETEDSRAQARQRGYEQDVVGLGTDWVSQYNQQAFSRSMAEFAANLGMNVNDAKFREIMRVAQVEPALANFLSQIYTPGSVPPDMLTMLSSKFLSAGMQNILRKHGGNVNSAAQEMMDWLMRTAGQMGLSGAKSAVQGAWQGATQ